MHTSTLIALFALLPPTTAAAPRPAPSAVRAFDYAKVSPFEAVRWEGDVPQVRLDGTWYGLRSIGGREIGAILDFCASTYGRRARKRFEEDLVQVLSEMGAPPGMRVDLELVDLETGAAVVRKQTSMTEANRRAIWAAAKASAKSSASAPTPRALAAADARADLDALEDLLDRRYAYRDRLGFDSGEALDRLRESLGAEVDRDRLAVEIAKVLARFGDGHTGVDRLEEHLPAGYLPALVAEIDGKLVASKPDRSGWLDAKRPVLVAIDGVAIERWIDAAAAIAPQGSAPATRRHAVRNLRLIGWLRGELGVAAAPKLRLELASLDGSSRRELEVAPSSTKPIYGRAGDVESRVLERDVGYLRIPTMDDEPRFLDAIDGAMERLRTTRGLVVDVRGNGGGSRAALLRLFPYFMDPDEPPHVANVAACRLDAAERGPAPEGHLADRWLFPRSASRWTDADRAAIDAVANDFRPDWAIDADDFSEWHYLVLRRADNPRAFSYAKPVVVLLDRDCFSATDVFLAAFAGRPRVTLVGVPSAGGSGRARGYVLPRSQIGVRLSSMISFRRDGRSIDGLGIDPDVVVESRAADWIGGGDAQLDAALAQLGGSR